MSNQTSTDLFIVLINHKNNIELLNNFILEKKLSYDKKKVFKDILAYNKNSINRLKEVFTEESKKALSEHVINNDNSTLFMNILSTVSRMPLERQLIAEKMIDELEKGTIQVEYREKVN